MKTRRGSADGESTGNEGGERDVDAAGIEGRNRGEEWRIKACCYTNERYGEAAWQLLHFEHCNEDWAFIVVVILFTAH